ncbi:hypothetical protein JJB98_01085 [Bradyrhizobium diazoefficiens]|nr:hypothetical protein [Bradyrhizobium diazoefficiens]QQO18607.1 hypothetical protein JJB98_01085 [Bradyrhizobium diazoefficiens]
MLNDEISSQINELMGGPAAVSDGGRERCLAGPDGVSEPATGPSVPTGAVRLVIFKDLPADVTVSKVAPRDSFARDIAQYRYENQKTLFAHLPRKDWPRLVRVRPKSPQRLYFRSPSGQRLKMNPFRAAGPTKVRALGRESMLRSEASRLYSAMAFAMWQYGRVMNAHMTILWKLLGVTDHDKAVGILSKYNHEAAKWLSVGEGDNTVRSRFSKRSSGASVPHAFVYVHEQAQEKGFHTHELMYVPLGRAQEFAEWSRDCLARLSGCASADEAAVFFSPASQKRKKFRPYSGARESFAVDRQWRWFRYLTKSLDPAYRERSPVDGGWHVARDIFQMTKPFMATGPVSCRKLAGCSENIGPGAQRVAGFVSKFERGDWAGLYNGSELEDYRADMAALAEAERAQAAQAELQAMLSNIVI